MLIKTKLEEFASYLEDTSNLKGRANALYMPQSKEEVPYIVRECLRKKTPFTVCAGRTGTTGGCVALEGVILSTENLKKISDIDATQKTVTVEAGVTLDELEKEIAKFNLTLLSRPTEPLALSGGVIATCASGVRGFGYGSVRKYVKALEIVLPTGELLSIRRGEIFAGMRKFEFELNKKYFKFNAPSYDMPKVKSQAGYFAADNMDLIDLFIGSEGTLGVITSSQLALDELPFKIFDGLIFFKEEQKALAFAFKIKHLQEEHMLHAASLEFFDEFSLQFLKPQCSFIPQSAAAALYFEQEADSEESFTKLLEQWASLIEESAAITGATILADTQKDRETVFKFRHSLPQNINEFLRSKAQVKAAADIAVPQEHFLAMYKFYKEKARPSGISYVNFGHIGEAHLHFNFLPQNDAQSIKARELLNIFCRKAVEFAGTVSAEHGIGKIKKPYLEIMYGKKALLEMAALKKYFDPHCLLGLDNVFDKEILFAV
ncbi:MAG: FAD-binding oxidoreductase [Candidatus Omnitrophica bacterium]|nr:FAD-binding oxidoreductase [Candidatus Omnitrophota bacterium]